MHLTATRTGEVWGVAAGQHPDDFAVANEGGIVEVLNQEDALAEVARACDRLTPLSEIAAHALIDGDDAMCSRLADGAAKVIAHLNGEEY